MANLYCWSGATGTGDGSSWANAKTNLTAAFVTEVAGDTIFVAHDHAESTAASITLASSGTALLPTKVICVNRAGSVPPVSADRRATAQVTTTGTSHLQMTGYTHFDGIIFNCGTGSGLALIAIPSSSALGYLRFDNCSLRLVGTAATAKISIGNGVADGSVVEWNNTTVSFAHLGQTISTSAALIWRNTPSALIGATIPTLLFTASSGAGGSIECIGVDLSAAGSGKTIVTAQNNATAQRYTFIDCKLDAAVTKSAVPTSHGSTDNDFIRCGSAGVNYAVHRHRMAGLLTEETVIVRTGGATG